MPTQQNPEVGQRQRLIEGGGNAVERFLSYSYRLDAPDLSFTATPVNTTAGPLTLNVFNGTKEALVVSAIEVAGPFSVQSPSPLPSAQSPTTINSKGTLVIQVNFTPTAVGAAAGTITLRAPGGEVLLVAQLSGTATAAYIISGVVTTSSGAPIQDVVVALSGARSATLTTGADGRYSFAGLPPGGPYTVTPSKPGLTFNPPDATFGSLSADSVMNFAATGAARPNVALAAGGAAAAAKSFTADGVFPESHFYASYAIDGRRYMHPTSTDVHGFWRDEHGLPSWLEVDFGGPKTIGEIDVFTAADYPANLAQTDPPPTQTFTQYGATAYDVQYWTGVAWQTVPNGSVTGNNLVWRKFIFPAVITTKVRVVVNAAVDNVARVVAVEAWGTDA